MITFYKKIYSEQHNFDYDFDHPLQWINLLMFCFTRCCELDHRILPTLLPLVPVRSTPTRIKRNSRQENRKETKNIKSVFLQARFWQYDAHWLFNKHLKEKFLKNVN